jgi:hypothetical protein
VPRLSKISRALISLIVNILDFRELTKIWVSINGALTETQCPLKDLSNYVSYAFLIGTP